MPIDDRTANLNLPLPHANNDPRNVDVPRLRDALTALDAAVATPADITAALQAHEDRADNPHSVTKAQVGLDAVDNTSDLDKPVSTAVQAAIEDAIAAIAADLMPVGSVIWHSAPSPPNGFLKANGAAVSRTEYADLFAVIGTTFGAGDGSTTFTLPDLRGEFVRGVDDGRGVDPGREVGSIQDSQNKTHTHEASTADGGNHAHSGSTNTAGWHGHTGASNTAGWHSHSASSSWNDGHAHSGTTTTNGSHSHEMERAKVYNVDHTHEDNPRVSTGAAGGDLNVSTWGTLSAGDHNHTFNTTQSGAHGHDIYVDGTGDHWHTVSVDGAGDHSHSVSVEDGGIHSHAVTVNSEGGAEARPRNVALLACIKY